MAAKKTVADAVEAVEAVVSEVKKNAKRTTKKAADAAEKKTTTRKTTTRKKLAPETYVQFWGKEINTAEVVETIKTMWTEEMGKKASEMKELKVYIKPEDNGAHYVINDEITGFIAL